MADVSNDPRLDAATRFSFPGFDSIRLVAAWAVVFTHSYFLASGSDTLDPLPHLLGGTRGFGDYAVQVFFILSGFLLSGSLDLSLDPLRYLANRLFRIIPGFCFAVVVAVLVIAPFLSDDGWRLVLGGRAWSSIGWSILMLKDVSSVHLAHARHAEFAWFMNGSLWSIPYEVICYLVLLSLYMVLRHDGRVGLAAAALAVFAIAAPGMGLATFDWDHGPPGVFRMPLAFFARTLPFFCGGVAYYAVHKRWGTPRWLVATAAVTLGLAALADVEEEALAFTGPVLIVALGSSGGWLSRAIDRVGDVSYGVYLFGWPVGLLVAGYVRSAGPVGVFALSVPLVFGLAYAMHRLVERPVAEALKPAVLRHLPRFVLTSSSRTPTRRQAATTVVPVPRAARWLAYGVCLVTIVRFVIYPYPFALDWFANLWTTLVAVCVVMAAVLAVGRTWARTT